MVQDINKEVTVEVKETANILTLIFKTAEVAGIKPMEKMAIFEISESLRLRMFSSIMRIIRY